MDKRFNVSSIPEDNPIGRINKQLMYEYLQYKTDYNAISSSSFETYQQRFILWYEWLFVNYGVNVLQATKSHIIDYANQKMGKLRTASINNDMFVVYSFYRWAKSYDKITEDIIPTINLGHTIRRAKLYIPTPQDIFHIRSGKTHSHITSYMCMEMLLSSGMRVGELVQIRCCDIQKPDPPIYDFELKKVSPFVGYEVFLNTATGLRIKNGISRKVYFSKIASDLIDIYMERTGLRRDSIVPLIPYDRKIVHGWIVKLGKALVDKQQEEKRVEDAGQKKRLDGLMDLNVDEIDGTEAYKKRIRAIQEAERKRMARHPGMERCGGVKEPPKKISFHPHLLRHFYTINALYRNIYGNRKDVISVRDLLGHGKYHTTDRYTSLMSSACKNDLEWRRLWIGNGFDYRRFKYS